MGASSNAKEDIGMSNQGEKFSSQDDMDIDDNEVTESSSICDLGEEFLKSFCRKASMSFFNQYGLISHQINSYNYFIKHGLQKAFDSFEETIVEPGYDPSKKGEREWRYASVRFGPVTVDKPTFFAGSGGDEHNMLPRHARLQNMTYSSRMKVKVHLQVNRKVLLISLRV